MQQAKLLRLVHALVHISIGLVCIVSFFASSSRAFCVNNNPTEAIVTFVLLSLSCFQLANQRLCFYRISKCVSYFVTVFKDKNPICSRTSSYLLAFPGGICELLPFCFRNSIKLPASRLFLLKQRSTLQPQPPPRYSPPKRKKTACLMQ